MKNNLNPSRELYNVILAIYGQNKQTMAIHAEINDIRYDRWGIKVDITLLDGTHIVGRLSNKHNFNGTTTKKDVCKTYRSYRA